MLALWHSPLAPLLLLGSYLVAAAVALVARTLIWGSFRDAEIAARGQSAVLPMAARMFFVFALQPLWWLVRWTGLSANAVTTLATLLGVGAGLAAAAGDLALGGWLYLGAGVCDVLDGRVARHLGTACRRGAAIDSVLDRYSDAAVLVGLSWHLRHHGWPMLVALVALVGSLLVSYVRARGEGLGVRVAVGVMQRPERVVLIGATLALAPVIEQQSAGWVGADVVLIASLLFVAVMTQLTAAHRLVYLLGKLRRGASAAPPSRYQRLLPALVSAALATGADFALVTLLVTVGGLSAAAATALGCLLGGGVNFSLNRWWTFSSIARPAPQALRYTIVSVSSALLNSGGVALVTASLLPDYRLAWVVVRAVVFLAWNFPLQRDYVYGSAGEGKPEPTARMAAVPARDAAPG